MTATTRRKPLGPFLGVNNRLPDFKLRTKDGDFLRFAVNVDVTDAGSLKRRAGYTQLVSGIDAHSYWSDGADAYYVDNGTLYKLTGGVGNPVSTAVLSGLADRAVSYARAGTEVYASNGLALYELTVTRGVAPVPPLAVEPVVTAAAGGALPGGVYQLCFVYARATGEESASTVPVRVEVADNGAIQVSGLPTVFPSGVAELRVYMTGCNDTVLAHAFTVGAAATLTITVVPTLGSRCMTLLMRPMPPGDIVRWLNGRLYVAAGSTVYYSELWAPTLFNPARNYIMFQSAVSVMEACNNGMYIAADQTYWMSGDASEAELQPVLPYGAVSGTGYQSPQKNECFWMSTRGMVRGSSNGEATNLQEAAVAVERTQAGATLFREHDGFRQVLSSLFGGEGTVAAASSWMEAEVVRKETLL